MKYIKSLRTLCVWYCISALNSQMHQLHTSFMLWAYQGSWIFQCPVTVRVVFFTFFESDSFRFKLLDKGYNICTTPRSSNILNVLPDWHRHRISCLGLEGSMNSGLTNQRTGSPFPLLICSTSLSFNHILNTGHSTLCSFSQYHSVPHILSSSFTPFLPQSFSHGLIPSIRPFLCPSQTIYQEWHPFPFYPSSFQHRLQHKTPQVKSNRRRVDGENEKRGMKDLGEKKSLISKALNPILYHGQDRWRCILRDCVCVCLTEVDLEKNQLAPLVWHHSLFKWSLKHPDTFIC